MKSLYEKNIKYIMVLSIMWSVLVTIVLLYKWVNECSISQEIPLYDIEANIRRLSPNSKFSGRICYNNTTSDYDKIPCDTVAVKVALVLLSSIYGNDIYEEKPYNVALRDSVWIIETSILPPVEMHEEDLDSDFRNETLAVGGIGHVEINKRTGKIYSVYHTK